MNNTNTNTSISFELFDLFDPDKHDLIFNNQLDYSIILNELLAKLLVIKRQNESDSEQDLKTTIEFLNLILNKPDFMQFINRFERIHAFMQEDFFSK